MSRHGLKCRWQKTANGYTTECSHSISVILRNAVYCPFCGGNIVKYRGEYQTDYYKANKGRLKQIRAKYYEDNKEHLKEYQKEYYRENVKK